jgi:hypothetical protein
MSDYAPICPICSNEMELTQQETFNGNGELINEYIWECDSSHLVGDKKVEEAIKEFKLIVK